MDKEIEVLIYLQPEESSKNSDVEVFANDGQEESVESSEEEAGSTENNPPNPLQWSSI